MAPADRWHVPTHLDTPDGIDHLTVRQLVLFGGTVLFIAPSVASLVPSGGPAIGDVVRATMPSLAGALAPGLLPLGATLATLVPIGIAALFALPLEPPVEHGLVAWAQFRSGDHLLGTNESAALAGPIGVGPDAKFAEARGQLRAIWEIPGVNVRLADDSARATIRERWARFLDGLDCPIQITLRSRPIDTDTVVRQMEQHPDPRAHEVASWLRALAHDNQIERTRLLAVAAPNSAVMAHRVDRIERGLRQAGLPGRRFLGDELVDVIQAGWSSRRSQPGQPIGPRVVQLDSDAVQVDGEWVRTYALWGWPRAVAHDWLAAVLDGPLPVDVTQHIVPLETDRVMRDLEHHLSRMTSTSLTRKRRVAIEDLEHLLERLERNEISTFQVAVYFAVRGESRTVMETRARHLEGLMQTLRTRIQRLRWEHADGLASCVGTGEDRVLRRQRRVDTGTIARTYPWSGSELVLEGGVTWGETLESHRPVMWTPWRRPQVPNPHLAMYAETGGGKGFGYKVWAERAIYSGVLDEVYILDGEAGEDGPEGEPRGEYGRFADMVGGEVRQAASLNRLAAQLGNLHGPCVVWNVSQLPMAQRPAAMVMIKHAVWARAQRWRRRTQLVLDEIWTYAQDPAAAHEIEHLVRAGRKYRLGLVAQTQRPADSLDTYIGRVIQSQAATQWYGMQNPSEITDIAERLHWTAEEVAAIRKFGQGDALLAIPGTRVTYHVTWAPVEFEMAHTDWGAAPEIQPDADDQPPVLGAVAD